MAVIDVAGFVADLKSQAIDHGFHVHDERHFVETYSLRQLWEVDLHPEEACSGPIDLHLSLDVDPRAMLGFEDEVMKLDDLDETPPAGFTFPLVFTWTLPPLPEPPDLLVLATELAGIGGVDLPVEVSAIDSFPSVTDAPERSLSMVARSQRRPLRRLPQQRPLGGRQPRAVQARQPVPARAGQGLARRPVNRPPRRHRPASEGANRMHVRELIDILSEQPPDAEVELAVIAPVEEDSDDITVDRYPVDGVLPWNDDDEEGLVIWLIGGEDDDVDAFLDAVEQDSTLTAGPPPMTCRPE